jgi:hypothetical protein
MILGDSFSDGHGDLILHDQIELLQLLQMREESDYRLPVPFPVKASPITEILSTWDEVQSIK